MRREYCILKFDCMDFKTSLVWFWLIEQPDHKPWVYNMSIHVFERSIIVFFHLYPLNDIQHTLVSLILPEYHAGLVHTCTTTEDVMQLNAFQPLGPIFGQWKSCSLYPVQFPKSPLHKTKTDLQRKGYHSFEQAIKTQWYKKYIASLLQIFGQSTMIYYDPLWFLPTKIVVPV